MSEYVVDIKLKLSCRQREKFYKQVYTFSSLLCIETFSRIESWQSILSSILINLMS